MFRLTRESSVSGKQFHAELTVSCTFGHFLTLSMKHEIVEEKMFFCKMKQWVIHLVRTQNVAKN